MNDNRLLDVLSLREMTLTVSDIYRVLWQLRRSQALFIQALSTMPLEARERLENVAKSKTTALLVDRAAADRSQRVRRRIMPTDGSDLSQADSEVEFLKAPAAEVVDECYRQFWEATGNFSLQFFICAVCARRQRETVAGRQDIPVLQLPNNHRLHTSVHRPSVTLTHGLLLSMEGCFQEEEETVAHVCQQCLQSLQGNIDKPPKYSLVNELWVGEVPEELRHLTIPEQFLIARKFPHVYVVKLFPKNRHGNPNTMQHALRGNVTTFDLNMDKIVGMVNGQLMPQLPNILPSILSVCYVGQGKLSVDRLKATFQVRRHIVACALFWLKHNNLKYYGDIEIDEERLRMLPEDDIPSEVTSTIRHLDDNLVIDEESSGYVPVDEDSEDELRTSVYIRRKIIR